MPASAARNPLPVQLLTIHPQQFRQRIDNFLFTAQRNNRTPIHGGVTPFVDAEINLDNTILDRTIHVLPTQMGQVNLTEAAHCGNLKAFA